MGGSRQGDQGRRDGNVIPFPVATTSGASPTGDATPARVHRLRHDVVGWFGLSRPPLLPRPPTPISYTVTVALVGSQPQIRRTLQLVSDLELVEVVEAVRTSFGWSGNVLHLCRVGEGVPGAQHVVLSPGYGGWGRAGFDEAGVQLAEVVARIGDGLGITIIDEGGDEWSLQLWLDAVDEAPVARRARCLGGERARPPLDAEDIETYNIAVAQWHAGVPSGQRVVWWPATHDPDQFDLAAADALIALVVADPAVSMTARQREVSNEVVDLYLRCMADGRAVIDILLAAAEIAPGLVPPHDVVEVVEPWRAMLEAVGDGVDWSRGRVPEDLGERLEHLPPVRHPRPQPSITLALRLGLLRKHRGRVVPTVAARRGREDPRLLWHHLADRMPPAGEGNVRDAGLLTMLQVAAGRDPCDAVTARVLDSAGWTCRDESITPGTAHAWSAAARDALAFTGAHLDAADALHATDAARLLCCAALAPGSRDRRAAHDGRG